MHLFKESRVGAPPRSAPFSEQTATSLGEEVLVWKMLRRVLEKMREVSSETPASWLTLIEGFQVRPFPAYHLAAVDYLIGPWADHGKKSPLDLHACHVVTTGLLQLVVEGGGLFWMDEAGREQTRSCLASVVGALETNALPSRDLDAEVDAAELEKAFAGKATVVPGPEAIGGALVVAVADLLKHRERLAWPQPELLLAATSRLLIRKPTLEMRQCLAGQLLLGGPSAAPVAPRQGQVPQRAMDAASKMVVSLQSLVGEAVDASRSQRDEEARPLPGHDRKRRRLYPSRMPKMVQRRSRREAVDTQTERDWSPVRHADGSLARRSRSDGVKELPAEVGQAVRWIGLAAIVLLSALVALQARNGQSSDPATALDEDGTVASVVAGGNSSDVSYQDAHDVADTFAYSEGIEERVALISDLRYCGVAREYFQSERGREEVAEFVQSLGQGRSGALSFFAFRVGFVNDTNRLICLVTNPRDGKLYVDWEAYIRQGTFPIDQLLDDPPAEASVRVFVERGEYYNFAFEDSHLYQCYQLASDDHDETFYGYVKRGTHRHVLVEHVLGNRKIQRMFLTLAHPSGYELERGQFEIARVLAADWAKDPLEDLEDSAFADEASLRNATNSVWLPTTK